MRTLNQKADRCGKAQQKDLQASGLYEADLVFFDGLGFLDLLDFPLLCFFVCSWGRPCAGCSCAGMACESVNTVSTMAMTVFFMSATF